MNGRQYFTASEVAEIAGVQRLTLLRWIREGRMTDVSRDRNGWRIFSEADAAQIADYASSLNERTSPAQTLLFHNLPLQNHG
jgi:excisionase family DNA binding protein